MLSPKMLNNLSACFVFVVVQSHTFKAIVNMITDILFGGELMVEIDVHKSETKTEKETSTSLDVNEIIGKVRSFVDTIKEMGTSGEPMAVSVEGFNVSVNKEGSEYTLGVNLSLALKPKGKSTTAESAASP
jgi:hypothetical protein